MKMEALAEAGGRSASCALSREPLGRGLFGLRRAVPSFPLSPNLRNTVGRLLERLRLIPDDRLAAMHPPAQPRPLATIPAIRRAARPSPSRPSSRCH